MAAGYAVQITAVDKATATLNKVNAALAGTLAPLNRMGNALAKLGDTSGINRLGSGLANLERQAVRTAEGMARIVPALGAITGAASLAGLARLASQWADFGDKLGFTSQRIGVSTQQLQSLQGAARLAGASSEAMTGGLRGLQQTLQDAVGGRNNAAVATFNKFGLSFRNAGGYARGVTEVLPELADKIAGIKSLLHNRLRERRDDMFWCVSVLTALPKHDSIAASTTRAERWRIIFVNRNDVRPFCFRPT